MYVIPFMKWMWTKLSDISETVHFDPFSENTNPIWFLGWKGSYGLFRISKTELPDGRKFDKILVAHEGNWATADNRMLCHPEYENYEDVQKDLGCGLVFVKKGFSKINRRSLFLYGIDSVNADGDYVLAVPATGEEIDFEIYGVEPNGNLLLLVDMEL